MNFLNFFFCLILRFDQTCAPNGAHPFTNLTHKLATLRNKEQMLPWGSIATVEFCYNLASISPDPDGNILTLEQAKLKFNRNDK
jgi:hypothetical protein